MTTSRLLDLEVSTRAVAAALALTMQVVVLDGTELKLLAPEALESSRALTIESFGGKNDGWFEARGGAMSLSSAVLSYGNAHFTSADVGKAIVVKGAGALRYRNTSQTIAAGGINYTVGQILTYNPGLTNFPARYMVTRVSAGVITEIKLLEKGLFTSAISNPMALSTENGAAGSGATLNVTQTQVRMPLVTTIVGFTNTTTITLGAVAQVAVTNAQYVYGTDNAAAIALLETARILSPNGTPGVFQDGIYCSSQFRILSRDSGGPGRTQDAWANQGGTTQLICVGATDPDYFVASNRWVDGQAWTGFPNTPFTSRNFRFDGSGLVKWTKVVNGYQCEERENEFIGGIVGQLKYTRQNQFKQVLTITGTATNGSPTLTSAAFVSSTGAAVSLNDIRTLQMIEGTGFAAAAGATYIVSINVGAGTITLSRNASVDAVGATYTINKNGAGNGYNSECKVIECEFDPPETIGCDYLWKSEGTTLDEGDAITDGYFQNNILDSIYGCTIGMWFGNLGGWFVGPGQHSYFAGTWDMFIYEMGGNSRWEGNQYENAVGILKVGTGLARRIGANTFWSNLYVYFGSHTSAEVLVVDDAKVTANGSTHAQIVCEASYANKTLALNNPTFSAGVVANSTAPILRPNNLGRIEVNRGRDGDGLMDNAVWDDGQFGPLPTFYHNSLSPAANDAVWREVYYGNNSAGAKKSYGSDEMIIVDPTAGSEDSTRRFYVSVAGAQALRFSLTDTVNSAPVPFFSAVTGGAAVGYYAQGEGAVLYSKTRNSADASGPEDSFSKSRGTAGTPATVAQFDSLGKQTYLGYTGAGYSTFAVVSVTTMSATPGTPDGEASWNLALCAPGGVVLTTRWQLQYAGAFLAGTKILGVRKTGWTPATGTATRTTFDTATVTLAQLAEHVKALIDDLHATAGHGLIGT
jgi:hypothetical protein